MSAASKYPESAEPHVSLGPVYSVNPRYVKRIEIVIPQPSESNCWLVINMVGNHEFTTELESAGYCEEKAAEILAANPAIEIVHYPGMARP